MSAGRKQPSIRLTREQVCQDVDAALWRLGFAEGSWGWASPRLQLQVVVSGVLKTVDLRYCTWSRRLSQEQGRFLAWAEGMGLNSRNEPQPQPQPVQRQGDLVELMAGG